MLFQRSKQLISLENLSRGKFQFSESMKSKHRKLARVNESVGKGDLSRYHIALFKNTPKFSFILIVYFCVSVNESFMPSSSDYVSLFVELFYDLGTSSGSKNRRGFFPIFFVFFLLDFILFTETSFASIEGFISLTALSMIEDFGGLIPLLLIFQIFEIVISSLFGLRQHARLSCEGIRIVVVLLELKFYP